MADLTGQTPAATYKGLLQVNDYTDGVTATAKYIQDGEGTDSALAISTSNVGIGTAVPGGGVKLHISTSSDTDSYAVTRFEADTQSFDVGVGGSTADIPALRNKFYIYDATPGGASSDVRTKLAIDSEGNIGIGVTSFGTDAASVLGIKNGTAPTSSPANMVQLYAEDVAASSELRVRDEAGNVTTLSPHAKDAPDSLYDQGKGADEMHRVANHYLGTITFTNVDRRNDLLQKQLNGEELPVDRTFKVTETFAEYNTRTGADLQVEDWDANQQAMADANESYVKKPKPEWLS